jgi:hypothetical protein
MLDFRPIPGLGAEDSNRTGFGQLGHRSKKRYNHRVPDDPGVSAPAAGTGTPFTSTARLNGSRALDGDATLIDKIELPDKTETVPY